MPTRVKIDLEIGVDILYLKTDPEQQPYLLTGIVVLFGNQIRFKISHDGEEIEVWDFEASTVRDDDKVKQSKEE